MPNQSKTPKGGRTSSRVAASQVVYLRRGDFDRLPPITLEVDGEKIEFVDYPAIARAYAEACVAGTNRVCRLVERACARYLGMLKMAEDPDNEFYFSPPHVVDYLSFAEKFRHFESGSWEVRQIDADGRPDPKIVFEPWQIWIECAIHGFRWRVTGERVVSTALEVIPRKSAKSLKAAIAALFDLCCSGQIAPEIPIAAASAKQADETLFGDLVKIVNNEPELVEEYALNVTKDEIRRGEGRIFKLTSLGERQDGLNPSLAIFEEGHAGAASVYRVVDSAFGARPNALRRMITTAGYRAEGPGYELIKDAKLILEGGIEDYSFFAAIYTLDREDYIDEESNAINWDRLLNDERLIRKANPMYEVSLDPRKILKAMGNAKRRPDLRNEAARTRFNIWTSSGLTLIDEAAWAACRRDLRLEDFFGQKCWIGVDLAQVLDMCAIALLFELAGPNPDMPTLVAFAKYFLPEASPTAIDPDLADSLLAWADPDQGGWLELTPGQLADHGRVQEEIDVYCECFDVQAIACDPMQAHATVKYLWDGNRPVLTYPNSARTMTGPTDDIIGRVAAQMIWHDGNPVLAWNAQNVHGERKGNGSIVPRKESDNSKRKIDGFVALCFANGVRLNPLDAKDPFATEKKVIDPFLARGGKLLGFEEPAHG